MVTDQSKPSAAIQIPLQEPLRDYDLEQLEQPTPRDVDAILVSQGFRDLIDDARGVLTISSVTPGWSSRSSPAPSAPATTNCTASAYGSLYAIRT